MAVSWYCSGMRPVSGGLKVMTEANRKAEFHTHCVHSSTTATFIFNIFVYFYHSLPHCLFISSVLELLLTLMESALPISLDHHESIKMWSVSAWKVQDGRTVRVFQFGESFDWSNGFCVSVCVCDLLTFWHLILEINLLCSEILVFGNLPSWCRYLICQILISGINTVAGCVLCTALCILLKQQWLLML